MSKRVAVVGSRDFPNLDWVTYFVLDQPKDATVITGGARGVDRAAEDAARRRGCNLLVIDADWETHGKAAGYRRNVQIVEEAECVVAFWDGKSKGTKHTIDLALKHHKRLEVIFA